MFKRSSYPLSDHCDGRGFFNPGGPSLPGLAEIFRWQRTRQAAAWPKHIPLQSSPLPAVPEADQVSVVWIGHASFLLQCAGMNVLLDPVFSERCGPFGLFGPKRVHAPGVLLSRLPPIDVVLVSHDHYDHCDLPALRQIARSHDPLAIAPLGNASLLSRAGLRQVVELDWWESTTVSQRLTVTLTPSQHWSNRLTGRRCARLWGGFHLRFASRSAHFVGDTGYNAQHYRNIRTRLGPPHLAMIPIGAYEPRWFMRGQHCNPAEAVQIHRDLEAQLSVAMHWGTFQLTDEGRDAPPRALAAALEQGEVSPSQFKILEPGHRISI